MIPAEGVEYTPGGDEALREVPEHVDMEGMLTLQQQCDRVVVGSKVKGHIIYRSSDDNM